MKSTSRLRSSSRFSRSGLIGVLLVCFAVANAIGAGQDSESFFHQGARHFLATNEIAQARLAVTNGLKIYPDDAKLKKLWDLLNQKGDGQSQNDQKQDQQDKDKENKDQQSKDQQSKDQQQKDQEKKQEQQKDQKSDEQQKQDQASKQDKDKKAEEEKKKAQQGEKKDQGENAPDGEGQPQQAAVKMTPQQAMQLLESLKAEEKAMPFRPILKTNRQDRIFKDW